MNKNLRLLAFLAIIIGIFYINNKFNNKLLSIYYQAKKIPEIIAMSATVCVLLFPSLVDKELLMNIPILGNLMRSPIFRILFSGLNLGEVDNKDEIKKTDLIKEDVKVNRKVSDSLKKYVAANQKWKCNMCNNLLEATYEVDHINPLYKGGSNEFNNLQALCRNCHGKKTMDDRLKKSNI
jgi:5-methylcytosine-specific restriction enzyme A